MVSSPLSYLAYSLIYHIKHDVQALIEPRMMLNSTGQMVPSPARDKSAELAAVIGDAAMFADPELLAEEPLAAGTSAFDITVAEGRPIVRLPELNVNVSGPGGTAGGPLPDLPAAVGRETYATAGPLVNRSGWGAKSQIPGYGTPAVDAWRYYEEIGVKLRPHRFDFPGTPGTYFASHAEPQALFMNPGADFMEVTRAPCPSCQDLISGEAVRRGWTIVVLSPRGFRWFFPNGMIWP